MFKTLGQKSLAGTAGMFALVAACGGAGLWSVNTLTAALTEANQDSRLLIEHMTADMMHDALRADVLAALTAAASNGTIKFEGVRADLKEHAETFRKSIENETSYAKTDVEKDALAGVKQPLGAYVSMAEHLVDLAARDPQVARDGLPAFLESFHQLEVKMETVTEVLDKDDGASVAQAKANADFAQALMIGILVICAIVCALLALGLRSFVVRPLVKTTDTMTALAGGDNNVEITGTQRGDEIGAMARALENFRKSALAALAERAQAEVDRQKAEKEASARAEALVVNSFGEGLKSLAGGDLTVRLAHDLPAAYLPLQTDFNSAMTDLQQAMQVIVSNVGGIRTGAGEISQAADDLSRRTEQQAASLEETAAALDEITATVNKTASGAREAANVVTVARGDADQSGIVVTQAIGAMGEIKRSADQISQIISVIDEIAFQTNLLALNAGVEAARAGDAGRGFAVVASEVRALAQRSQGAAKEIKTLISESSQHVSTGVDLVGRAGAALQQIAGKVADISSLVTEISSSAQEQATGLSQVNTAVNQMDQVTQQNAAMVEESTAASRSLAKEADELSVLVSRFNIGEAGGGKRAAPTPVAAAQQRVAKFAATRGGAAAKRREDEWEEF